MSPLKWFQSKQQEDDETIAVYRSKKKSQPKPAEDETLVVSSPIKKRGKIEEETIMVSGEKEVVSEELYNIFEEEGENTVISSKPKLSIIQKWTMKVSNKKAQTILSTAFPLNNHELEAVRTQTLVSLNHTPSVIEWNKALKEKGLEKAKAQELLKFLNACIARGDMARQNKASLNQLKNALIIRTKLLSEEDILINIVNQGYRSFYHTLDRLCFLTSDKKLNRKIGQYLYHETQAKLLEHAENFRKQILSCKTAQELSNILDKYTLKSSSILRKYPSLKIIASLKNIQNAYQKRPDRLVRILNKFLGVYGEVNIKEKLSQLLLTSESDAKIFQEILRLNALPDLLKKLENLKKHSDTSQTANKLLILIQTYAEPGEKVGFSMFYTSLNKFSPALAQKVLNIVRHSIAKELKQEIQKLIVSKESPLLRLLSLEKLLKNPRYEDPSILIFGYSLNVLLEKINAINPAVGPELERDTKHILSHAEVPANFLTFLIDAKKARYKASKF